MRYLRSSFYAKKGQAVKISFDKPAKVLLLSDRDFRKYSENSGTITYWGGNKPKGPAVLEVPSAGTWHAVIELGEFTREQMNGSVELLSELPEGFRPVREIEAASNNEIETETESLAE
jgi:hypothetical protein